MMRVIALILLILFSSLPVRAEDEELEPCYQIRTQPWLREFSDQVRSHDDLYRYSVQEHGQPTGCNGRVTQQANGETIGRLEMSWKDGLHFSAETLPQGASLVALHFPAGLNDDKLMPVIQLYMVGRGFEINWNNVTRITSPAGVIKEYTAPESGRNVSVRVGYDGQDNIIDVKIHSAL